MTEEEELFDSIKNLHFQLDMLKRESTTTIYPYSKLHNQVYQDFLSTVAKLNEKGFNLDQINERLTKMVQN